MAAPLRQKYGLVLRILTQNSRLSRHVPVTTIGNICNNCKNSRRVSCRPIYAKTICKQEEILNYKVGYRGSSYKGDNFLKQHVYISGGITHLVDILSASDHWNAASSHGKSQLHNGNIRICHRTYCSESRSLDEKRDKTVSQADSKTENIYTVPNFLTLTRVMLTPVIGVLVVQQSFPAALALFTFAGVTDWLDGYIARNFKNQMSTFGTAMDPLADKILVSVLTVTLTMAHLLPVPLAVVILGRDVLLVISGFVIRYVSLPPPFTLRRYFDGTIPTVKLSPSTLSKVNTGLQLSLVCLTLAAPVFGFVDHPALQCLWYVTAATTLGSGIDYVLNRNKYVKYLKLR